MKTSTPGEHPAITRMDFLTLPDYAFCPPSSLWLRQAVPTTPSAHLPSLWLLQAGPTTPSAHSIASSDRPDFAFPLYGFVRQALFTFFFILVKWMKMFIMANGRKGGIR